MLYNIIIKPKTKKFNVFIGKCTKLSILWLYLLKYVDVGKLGTWSLIFRDLCRALMSLCSDLKSLNLFHTVTFVTALGQLSGYNYKLNKLKYAITI